MATKVFDSWALMAFFQDEPAAAEVERIIVKANEGRHRLLLCVINWGEFYYSIARNEGVDAAEKKSIEVFTLGFEIVPVSENLQLAREAAILKASKKMSYADCFAAALAKLNNAELVTGDPEFKEVEREVKVSWLPRK